MTDEGWNDWAATAAASAETGDLAFVVARLKAEDEEDRKEATEQGRDAGEEWAMSEARPKQLRILTGLNSRDLGHDTGDDFAFALFAKLHPRVDFTHGVVSAFWEFVLGEGGEQLMNDPDFAAGFVRGALDVWDKVKDKV